MTPPRQTSEPSENDPICDKKVQPSSDELTQKSELDSQTSARNESINDTGSLQNEQSQNVQRNNRDVPRQFGRYRIERELGKGGMGIVYLAHDDSLDRDVALKVPFFGDDADEAIQRFHREARAMATLHHINLCPIYDVGQFEQWHFLTMAYIEGHPLSQFIRNQGTLASSQAAKLLMAVANAVQKAHEAGIVHRDLKPSNIMLTNQGEPVIMDFGLARRQSADEVELTRSHTVLGTPAYMAPEQVEASHDEVGAATDVYAMGIILYEMIAGRRPFRGSAASIYGQIVSRVPDPPSRWCSKLSSEMDAICLKAIAKSPRHRHASAAEFAEDLSRYLIDSSDQTQQAVLHHDTGPVIQQPGGSDEPSGSRLRRDAELRQVTLVTFAYEPDESSLSDASTSQSELMHDQAQTFAAFVDDRVQQLGGVTLPSFGEEIIACFGFPRTFEDASQRAVRLAIQVMRELSPGDPQSHVGALPTREQTSVTIHSGEAVAEVSGETTDSKFSLVGEARNTVTRLSVVTEPGTIVMSAATYQRVKLYFHCESLGSHRVRGMGQLVESFRVVKEAASQNRVELVDPGNLTPLVGRDTELTILKDRWEQTLDELGQIVLLIGDAGLGKSRLIRELREHVIAEDKERVSVIELRCSQYHLNAAYFPLVEYLSRLLQLDQAADKKMDVVVRYLSELELDEPANVSLFCQMLDVSLDDRYPPLELSPQRRRSLTEELLLKWLRRLVSISPVLFIIEDLHWVDPSTFALIQRHFDTFESGRTLTLFTFRPEFKTPWTSKPHQTQIALNRLTKRQIGEMVKRRTNRDDIPDAILQQVIDRTEGIPLFVEEFSNVLIESGLLDSDDVEENSVALRHTIPGTLHDLLLARLDRMDADQEVVQLAATMGREFSFELLAAASKLPESELRVELDKLVQAEILFQKGKDDSASYIFKHALLQDAAYAAMLSKKRQACHRQIVEAIESQFGLLVDSQPALLAQHCTQAGLTMEAIAYWLKAGQQAQQRSANTEAINHLTRGLELLQSLNETPLCNQLELGFQLTLAPVLMAARGWSATEVGTAIERAQQLVSRSGTLEDQFFVMWGLWGWRLIRADVDICVGIAKEILQLVETSPEGKKLLPEAFWVIGATDYYRGDFEAGLELLDKGVALIDPQLEREHSLKTGQRCGLMCRSHAALALWQLGFPDQALLRADEMLQLAKEQDHAFTLAMSLFFRRQVLEFCGLQEQASVSIEEEYTVCHENGFVFFEVHAVFGRGDLLLRQGNVDEAREQFDRGLALLNATGGKLSMDHPYRNIAESFLLAGHEDDAKQWLERGFDLVNNRNERGMESEFLRLQGELALAGGDQKIAEERLLSAIEVSQKQKAMSWELRATTSLAQLKLLQSEPVEARQILRPTFARFTEGFGTMDLVRAKELLSQLEGQA